jgi:hypothetical protein
MFKLGINNCRSKEKKSEINSNEKSFELILKNN